MITVNPRAHRSEDRAGDPLDGLVNLFDVGIVLAVGFLLAALASLNLSPSATGSGLTTPPRNAITVKPGDTVSGVPSAAASTAGQGTPVGRVYRLNDGRLIYVIPSAGAGPSATAPASPSVTPSR